MNYIRIILTLLVLLPLYSCEKTASNADEYIRQHSYLFDSPDLTIILSHKGITVFRDGEYIYQNLHNNNIEGLYPTYRFVCNEVDWETSNVLTFLTLNINFTDKDHFTASTSTHQVEGIIRTGLGRKDISFSLPAVMNFVKNDEYVDINLDGILDKWQPDLFQ